MTRFNSARPATLASLLLAAGGCTATTSVPRPVVTVRTEAAPASALADSLATAVPQGDTLVVRRSGPATSRVAASPAAADATATSLPRLPGGQAALADVPERRVAALDASGSDIRDVAARLGREFGLQVTLDPQVQGTVTAHLRNVSLNDALRDVVTQNGYQWAIQGGVLHVSASRLETRIFTLDYVALSRFGSGSTVIQRRLGSTLSNNGSGAIGLSTNNGVGGGGLSGADVISSVSAVDMWQEIRIALTGLLTPAGGSPAASTSAPAGVNQTPTNNTGGANVITASSMSFGDGSSLTISPVSGLISVTATPDKMAEVSTFLDAFRASIERQVLIEAKIVEVNLSKSTQYGIDWNAITKAGSVGVNLTNAPGVATAASVTNPTPGNVTFSLTGKLQINAVLNALSTQGDVSVLSSPRTSALNNQIAVFQVTTDQTFFTVAREPFVGLNGSVAFQTTIQPQQVSVGIVLDVLPQISAGNIITMSVRPAVTSVIKTDSLTLSDGTTAQAPEISRREGDTMARLRDGETMVIGGLMQTSISKQVSGVPVLKDLPFIGGLFRHVSNTETHSELVVFLTPTVISGQPGGGG